MKNPVLLKIGKELHKGKIAFSYVNEAINIPLPNDFGIIEIIIWRDEEDSIQLLNGSFHTHGDIEARQYNTTREKAIRFLMRDIFKGKYQLIEDISVPEKPVKRIIESYFSIDYEHIKHNEI